MGWLIFAAVLVAIASHPSGSPTRTREGSRWEPPTVAEVVTWAVVCVAMVAGLVTWAVLR